MLTGPRGAAPHARHHPLQLQADLLHGLGIRLGHTVLVQSGHGGVGQTGFGLLRLDQRLRQSAVDTGQMLVPDCEIHRVERGIVLAHHGHDLPHDFGALLFGFPVSRRTACHGLHSPTVQSGITNASAASRQAGDSRGTKTKKHRGCRCFSERVGCGTAVHWVSAGRHVSWASRLWWALRPLVS